MQHPSNMNDFTLPPQYQLRQRLGEGGFGEVFEAWDDKLARSVAVKRLKHLGDAAGSGRLLKEARLAASLQHSAFVKIYALEETAATQSIVMELVRGQTLRQLMPVEQAQALAIVRQIAEAMREAHDSGLVHGDLKPSNIMVEPSGAVRILDFGLASQTDSQVTMTLAQADPQGTIAYMAPERMLGQALTPQTDIYALGVIGYELLTGARPFPDLSGLALAAAHVQSSADSWPYPAGLDPELVKLVQAMSATTPQRRLHSMQQVCERLAALDGVPYQASPLLPLKTWWRPHQRKVLITGGVLLALAGAWLVIPHLPSIASMQAAVKPYSEAVEMREGLNALRMWDLPGGLTDSEKHFATILERNPNNAAAVAGMAMVYTMRYINYHQDDVWRQKAHAAVQQALLLNDQLALSHIAKGTLLNGDNQPAEALLEFERAHSLDPDNIFTLGGKVSALIRLKRFDEALSVAQTNLASHPQERWFADQIGTVYYKLGRYPEAEDAFRNSLRIQPDAVFAYANLSATLGSQDKQDEALRVLQQGLEVRPSAWLYGNLGNMLFLRGDYVGAASAFEAAVKPGKGDPADYLDWANLGDTLLWIPGREGEARAAYARASDLLAARLQRTPNDVTMVSRMALYYARSGQQENCENMLVRALSLAPEAADVQFRAGMAYELVGNRAKALAAIARAMQLGYPRKFVESAPELVKLRNDPDYAAPR